MDKKNKPIEYHKMIWKAARDETVTYYRADMRNWVGNIVVGIISGYSVPYLLQKWGGITMPDPLLQFIVIAISAIIGALFWGLIIFGVNGLWEIPAKLFVNKDREASKFNWDYLIIDKKDIRDAEILRAYGIILRNEKAYDIRIIRAQIQYMEVDGKPEIEEQRLLKTQKGRRLGWLWNSHRVNITEQSLDKNGGEATIDLFKIPNQFSFFEFSETKNDYIAKDLEVEESVRGEILFVASYGIDPYEWIPIERIYNFTITISPNKEPIMIFRGGRIYKPPEIER